MGTSAAAARVEQDLSFMVLGTALLEKALPRGPTASIAAIGCMRHGQQLGRV